MFNLVSCFFGAKLLIEHGTIQIVNVISCGFNVFVLGTRDEKWCMEEPIGCPESEESFPHEAAEVVAENTDGAAALQGLQPPIVALRCGHPLHLGGRNDAVTGGSLEENGIGMKGAEK